MALPGSVAGAVIAAAVLLPPPAAAVIGDPVPDGTGAIFNEDQWNKGTVTFNQAVVCRFGSCDTTYYGQSGIHAPKATPKAGETFYVHAWAALLWPVAINDVAGMSMGLPAGVSVAVSASTPVKCYVTGTRSNNIPTRNVSGCLANPSPTTGSVIPLGAVDLFTGGPSVGGEVVHVFVPVRADRAVNGENVTVTTTFSDPDPTPRDLIGDAPLTVATGTAPTSGPQPTSPGPTTGPGPQPTTPSAALAKPGGKSFKRLGRGKVKVSWEAVPGAVGYQLRLQSGKKLTKWKSVLANKARLVKLKSGKKYVLHVRAVGAAGKGPVAKWRFKA